MDPENEEQTADELNATAPEQEEQHADDEALEQEISTEEEGQGDEGPTSMLEAIEESLEDEDPSEAAAQAALPEGEGGEDEQGAGDGEQQQTGDQATAQETPEQEAARKRDELLAPLPDKVAPRTRERFDQLTEGYKELEGNLVERNEQYQALETDHNGLLQMIADTGTTAQEFAGILDLARMVNSGQPDDLTAAKGILLDMAQRVDLAMAGDDGGALLAAYPDLQQKVDDFEIDEESALELARARRDRAVGGGAGPHQDMDDQGAVDQGQVDQGEYDADTTNQLNEVSQGWRSDPDFAQKYTILEKRLPELMEQTNPKYIVRAVEREWEVIGRELAEKQAQQRRNKPRPLSSSSARGGGKGQPSNMFEAIEEAIG